MLRETSEMEANDNGDSREGRRLRSEACRVSEARGGSGTANEGSEIVNGKDSETVANEDSGDGIDSNEGADLRSEGLRSSDEVENSKTVTGEDSVKARDLSANKVSSDGEESSLSNREFAGSSMKSRRSDVDGDVS